MKPCRTCRQEVAEDAFACPRCGAPFPARDKWDGFGFEYKSPITICGLPLLHVSFKYRANRAPVPACGVIAIGQFASGIVTIAQFGAGVFCVSQFALGGWVLGQFALAYSLIAQMGLYIHEGHGQFVGNIVRLWGGH